MAAWSMVMMGLADSVSTRRTREPVTMTSSIDVAFGGSLVLLLRHGALHACNCDSEAVASAKRTELVSEEFDIFSS